MSALRPLFAPLLLALFLAPAGADTILRIDGGVIEGVEVRVEGLKEVEYRQDGKKQTMPSDEVLRIQYSAMPALVDQAEAAAAEGELFAAVTDLETYLNGFLAGGRRERYEWAPAYAAWRLLQLQALLGEFDKSIATAQVFIEKFPEARYLPMVYLAKAEAHSDKGEKAKALSTLGDLEAVVQSKGLSKRWALEAELGKVLFDSALAPDKRRERLIEVSSKAGREHPTVRAKAEVAQGEALVEAKKLEEAEKIFQRVVDDPKASSRTLAGAYTGLGECLFQRGVRAGDTPEGQKLLKDALLAFMRVAVVFKDEARYVPKAMFYAGRVLDLQRSEESRASAQKLYSAVIREYDGSTWASEARGFRKR